MKYIIDTNVFLRVLITNDDQTSEECISLLVAIKRGKMSALVPGLVLSEVAWTLKSYYGLPKHQVVEAVEGIINLHGLKIVDGYDYSLAISMYGQKKTKFIDCCIASMAEIMSDKLIIVSYDKDFDKLGVLRQTPGEVLSSLA